ncbi:MAG: autotransporter outer membrane beta-barrel domain-containing protein [Verrucomicrobiota bacterium]
MICFSKLRLSIFSLAFFAPGFAFGQSAACNAWNLIPDTAVVDLRVTNPLTSGILAPTLFASGERFSVDFNLVTNGGASLSDLTFGFRQGGVFTTGFPTVLVMPPAQNFGTLTFVNGITGLSTLDFTAIDTTGLADVIQVQFTNFGCTVPTPPPAEGAPETGTTPPAPTPDPVTPETTETNLVIDVAPIVSFQETSEVHTAFSQSNFITFSGMLEGIRTRMRTHHAGRHYFHQPQAPDQIIDVFDPKAPIIVPQEIPNRFQIFAQGNLNLQDKDAIRDDPGFDGQMETGSAGLEYFLTPNWLIGAAITSGENELNIEGLGRGEVSGEVLNLYTSFFRDGWYADLRYARGWMDSHLERYAAPSVTTVAETESSFHAVTFEAGKNFQVGGWFHGPIIGGDYLTGGQDGYRERGGGNLNLMIDEQDYSSLISRIGWTVSRPFNVGNVPVIPQIRATWERDWENDPEAIGYTFETSPISIFEGDEFVGFGDRPSGEIPIEAPGQDWLSLGATLSVYLGKEQRWNVALNYETQVFRRDYSEHFGSLRVGFSF